MRTRDQNKRDRQISTALSAQRLRSLRRTLIRLTRGGKAARILAIAAAAGEPEKYVRDCYLQGKLHGFDWVHGPNGGFRCKLRLIGG